METIDMDRLKTGEVNLGVRRAYSTACYNIITSLP